MAFDRLKAALLKLRGTADVGEMRKIDYQDIPSGRLVTYAEMAARSCTWLCRSFVKANMAARGIRSEGLTEAIDAAEAYWYSEKGIVRFRLGSGVNPYPERSLQGGVWMIAAAQDAGRVVGIKAQAFRAKRTIKRGLQDLRTTRRISQIHDGRKITREAINMAGVKVVPGKKFWEFSAGQQSAIKAHFRKNFLGLVKRHRGGK